MGIGVQSEPGREVAQHAADDLLAQFMELEKSLTTKIAQL